MITCDTSALLTLVNRRDRDYVEVRAAAERAGSPYIAAVIACAERRGGLVLTLERRHVNAVAGEGRVVILP